MSQFNVYVLSTFKIDYPAQRKKLICTTQYVVLPCCNGACSIKIHTYIHTYIHLYIHTHTFTHTYIHTYTHTHTYIHTYIHTYTHTYTYIHTYIHMYVQCTIRCTRLLISVVFTFLLYPLIDYKEKCTLLRDKSSSRMIPAHLVSNCVLYMTSHISSDRHAVLELMYHFFLDIKCM